jgi:FAD/FMN-containing dehydrogenase/SAM-dependent methyltransferase
MSDESRVVNDVTRLNPIEVWAVVTPRSVEEVQQAVRRASGPISVGGGRFSMGGHVASPGSLHLDLRGLNRIVSFNPGERILRVEAGARWCDLQRFLEPHGLVVKVMQSYANFTVGGSLSVNAHGRYVGLGPLVLSVRRIVLVTADGERVEASREERPELFWGAVGGYGGLGVIVEAERDLAETCRIERAGALLRASDYLEHFRSKVRHARDAVFHNADVYPPHYADVRSVTRRQTEKPVTVPHRLMPLGSAYRLQRYFIWAVTETPFGKWRKQHIVDPLLHLRRRVVWRSYEAGYDVAELEPASRLFTTYVLQEYFVPVERFDEFLPRMAEILRRHRVNALNVSIRHAIADPRTVLSWAPEECFAFVLYYKQRVRPNARTRVAVWTRELIDAALACGGRHYLPYQVHATPEQFHLAYPRAEELFELKRRVDPEFRFRGRLWDTYYAPRVEVPTPRQPVETASPRQATGTTSEFHQVMGDTRWHDRLYLFLQNVYRLYREDRFHALIREACDHHETDEGVYRELLERLPRISPFLQPLRFALPSLAKQKREMTRQTLELLGDRRRLAGCLEIGTTGRYVSALRRHVELSGDLVLMNDVAPGYSPVDIAERGGPAKLGRFLPLSDYAPIPSEAIPDASLDLVSCFIGLHHAAPETLGPFLASLHRVLRPGGVLLLRDHDVGSPEMRAFVSLVHTVFNAGLGEPWSVNAAEPRFFEPVSTWSERLCAAGFVDSGQRLRQPGDPTDNLLMAFSRPEGA